VIIMENKTGLGLSLNDDGEMPKRTIERASMRESVREKTPIELARERAAQIMAEIGNEESFHDEFIAPNPPEGWSYEWKAIKIMNKVDETKLGEVRRTGWTEVPRIRHPEMMPFSRDVDFIERKGQILFERPAEITEEFRRRARKTASDAISNKKQQLGLEARGPFSPTQPKISTKYEPMAIPE
jgi:hypothetical protein